MGVVDGLFLFFFSSRRRHTRSKRDWSSDVCSSDLPSRNRASIRPMVRRSLRSSSFVNRMISIRKLRSEERRVGKSVDLGGRRIIKKKKNKHPACTGQSSNKTS